MKVRTQEQLFDLIAADLGWRRQELLTFERIVDGTTPLARPSVLRASVALLYAHWEGFVKNCVYLYLCYLASKKLSLQALRPEIAGLALRSKIDAAWSSSRPAMHSSIVRQLREHGADRASVPNDRDAVRTRSNLNFEVLTDILESIGCDAERYRGDRDLIDGELVASRNRIVHGEYETLSLDEWRALRESVLRLIEEIAEQIVDSAVNSSYLAWRA